MAWETCCCSSWESRVSGPEWQCVCGGGWGPSTIPHLGPVSQGAPCSFVHLFVHLFILKDESQQTFTGKQETRLEIGCWAAWVQILALPLTSWVVLGKFLNFSLP